MALYSHRSRRKRMEAALTVILLWLCTIGFLIAMEALGSGIAWTNVISDWWEALAASLIGAGALIGYVLREPR